MGQSDKVHWNCLGCMPIATIVLITVTGVLTSIDLASCTTVRNDTVNNRGGGGDVDNNTRSCCSYGYECDNVTGPATVLCEKPKVLMLLQPHIFPNEAYTIIQGKENYGKGVLVHNSKTIENFCIVWDDLEEDTNSTEKYRAALICKLYKVKDEISPFVFNIFSIALLMSALMALVTLAIYLLLPWLRDLQGKIVMSLLLSVSIGYISLAVIRLLTHKLSHTGCVTAGFMVYYWLFASFTWLHITSFNIWRTIALRSSRLSLFKNKQMLFAAYSVIGWGLPGVFLIISLLLEFVIEGTENSIRPGIGERMCFIHNFRDTWVLFYGPLSIIILTNVYYFISVIYYLNKMHKIQEKLNEQKAALENQTLFPVSIKNSTLIRRRDKHKKHINTSKNKYNIYSKLFFAMGITFIFELISAIYYQYNDSDESFILKSLFYVMDMVNALQGVILFVVLILLRKRVLRAIFDKMNVPITRIFPNLAHDENNIDVDYSDVEDECWEPVDDTKQIATNGINAEQRVIQEIQMS